MNNVSKTRVSIEGTGGGNKLSDAYRHAWRGVSNEVWRDSRRSVHMWWAYLALRNGIVEAIIADQAYHMYAAACAKDPSHLRSVGACLRKG